MSDPAYGPNIDLKIYYGILIGSIILFGVGGITVFVRNRTFYAPFHRVEILFVSFALLRVIANILGILIAYQLIPIAQNNLGVAEIPTVIHTVAEPLEYLAVVYAARALAGRKLTSAGLQAWTLVFAVVIIAAGSFIDIATILVVTSNLPTFQDGNLTNILRSSLWVYYIVYPVTLSVLIAAMVLTSAKRQHRRYRRHYLLLVLCTSILLIPCLWNILQLFLPSLPVLAAVFLKWAPEVIVLFLAAAFANLFKQMWEEGEEDLLQRERMNFSFVPQRYEPITATPMTSTQLLARYGRGSEDNRISEDYRMSEDTVVGRGSISGGYNIVHPA